MYLLHKLHDVFIDEKDALDLPVGGGRFLAVYHAQLLLKPHVRGMFF